MDIPKFELIRKMISESENKGSISFVSSLISLILAGAVGQINESFAMIFIMAFFVLVIFWMYFSVKWIVCLANEQLARLPSIAKGIVEYVSSNTSNKGETEIDAFLKEIEELDLSKVSEDHETEAILKKYERHLNIQVSDSERRRLIKKTLGRLADWTQRSSEDSLVSDGELMVWMWLYDIVKTMSEGLNRSITKSECNRLFESLSKMTKYNAIWKLTTKGEYPECDLDIILKNGERGLLEESATIQKSRSVREMHGYSGFSASIRIAKGLSYRIGTIKPITSTKIVQYTDDYGKFIITNQRVGFVGEKQNFLIPINKIIQFNASGEGLFIMKENSSKMHHIVLSDYDLPVLVLQSLYNDTKSFEVPGIAKTVNENRLLPPAQDENADYIEEISRLAVLRESGAITESEFTEKKQKLLGIDN